MFCQDTDREDQHRYQQHINPSHHVISYNYLPQLKHKESHIMFNSNNFNNNNHINQLHTNQSLNIYQHQNHQHSNHNPNVTILQKSQLLKHRQYNQLNQSNKNKKNTTIKQRNQNIAAILTVIITFTDRIEKIKQKIAGYPAESFSPAQFYNLLDLNQKGYVDIYDVKKFINNPNLKEIDIIALFKKANAQSDSHNSSQLNYFGYLSLIKPYFNEQLAKQILMRDTLISKSRKIRTTNSMINNNDVIESTQSTVLLLFQELMLLHCICRAEHETAKQMLMQEYMLNTNEIKHLLGFRSSFEADQPNNHTTHRSSLKLLHEFIECNSDFKVDFTQMKYLLSFLNSHEFNISDDKHISTLFLPIDSKKDMLREVIRNKKKMQNEIYQNIHVQSNNNNYRYMHMYLNKQNLINKGNRESFKDYFQNNQGINRYLLNENYLQSEAMKSSLYSKRANFLQFVHPQSLNRVEERVQSPHVGVEHAQIMVNLSDKNLILSRSKQALEYPKDNMNINKLTIDQLERHKHNLNNNYNNNNNKSYFDNSRYENNSNNQLKDEFFEGSSRVASTPFLEQFMKESQVKKNVSRSNNNNQIIKNTRFSPIKEDSQFMNSNNSSAFEIVEYRYPNGQNGHINKNNNKYKNKNNNNNNHNNNNESRTSLNLNSLESRYHMVISGYQNNKSRAKHEINQQRLQNSSQKYKANNLRDNYIDAIGMSHSNLVNQSSLHLQGINNHMNTNKNNIKKYGQSDLMGGRSVLDDFIRKG